MGVADLKLLLFFSCRCQRLQTFFNGLMMTMITIDDDDDDEENEEENSDDDEKKEGEEPGFLTVCFL